MRFRVFYNARYYYAIFAILFLDYGLTLEQFAQLNVLWALSIVVAEVPSGALADILGRRNLLVAGASLMCLEMLVLLVAPIDAGWITLSLFAVNRLASGLSEAMVSGADEALAYDSLSEEGDPKTWPRVLERTGQWLSGTLALTMVVGSLVYDPQFLNRLLGWAGTGLQLERGDLLRVPIALTLVHGLIALVTALRMTEPKSFEREPFSWNLLKASFSRIFSAARWTLGHRFVLFVILAGVIIDSSARQFIILTSEYLRIIAIPEYAFGFLSAVSAFLGILWAKLGRRLAENHSALANLLILSALVTLALVGLAFAIPYWGVLFVVLIGATLSLVPFLQSHYINREVDSGQRATVLSFRGLGINLGLGLASILYGLLVATLKSQSSLPEGKALEQSVFVDALAWFPGYYLVLLGLLLVAGRVFIRKPEKALRVEP